MEPTSLVTMVLIIMLKKVSLIRLVSTAAISSMLLVVVI